MYERYDTSAMVQSMFSTTPLVCPPLSTSTTWHGERTAHLLAYTKVACHTAGLSGCCSAIHLPLTRFSPTSTGGSLLPLPPPRYHWYATSRVCNQCCP